MLLTPHRSAESIIFADHQGLAFCDFVKAGELLGMREAVLAYMDEAAKSRKTISEFCEEVVSSFEKNPEATKAAMDVVSQGNFRVSDTIPPCDRIFTFEPDVDVTRSAMSITVHQDTTYNEVEALSMSSPSWMENTFASTIQFEIGDFGKICQITEQLEVTNWTGGMISKTTGTAKLDEHNHIFDVTERYYDANDMLHPSTRREIVLGNGNRLTLDQDSCLRPIEVYDKNGYVGSLDNSRFDITCMSYENIMDALYGDSEVGDDDFCYATDTTNRMPATHSCNAMESECSPFANVDYDEFEIDS